MFVTNCISTTKIQKISEITNFFRHYFLSRTEVVYKFDAEITEAEVQVKGTTGAIIIAGSVDANNVFTFKPTAAGWYAIKYLAKVDTTPAVYTYKVVKVVTPATTTE